MVLRKESNSINTTSYTRYQYHSKRIQKPSNTSIIPGNREHWPGRRAHPWVIHPRSTPVRARGLAAPRVNEDRRRLCRASAALMRLHERSNSIVFNIYYPMKCARTDCAMIHVRGRDVSEHIAISARWALHAWAARPIKSSILGCHTCSEPQPSPVNERSNVNPFSYWNQSSVRHSSPSSPSSAAWLRFLFLFVGAPPQHLLLAAAAIRNSQSSL